MLLISQVFLWFIAAALMISAICLIVHDRRETQLEHLRLRKMRGEAMYREVYAKLLCLRRRGLEVLEISEEAIYFRYFRPDVWEERYDFVQHGFKRLSQSRVHTLALLAETDYEELRDPERYKLRRKISRRANGSKAIRYAFIIRPDYKDILNRLPRQPGRTRETLTLRRYY